MILGIDPSLTGTGWSVMERGDSGWEIVETGILKTSPVNKKAKIYKADDDARRIRYVFEGLAKIVVKYRIEVAVSEMPSGGGKSASAVKGMAFATAIVACLAESWSLALVTVTARDSKMHNCRKANASKTEMQNSVAVQFPDLAAQFHSSRSANGYTGDFEDIADSICAVLTVVKDPAVVMGSRKQGGF